jgi:DNA-directed RNA polymerase specialized sigma24 family protein
MRAEPVSFRAIPIDPGAGVAARATLADDVVQEASLSAWRGAGRFMPEGAKAPPA